MLSFADQRDCSGQAAVGDPAQCFFVRGTRLSARTVFLQVQCQPLSLHSVSSLGWPVFLWAQHPPLSLHGVFVRSTGLLVRGVAARLQQLLPDLAHGMSLL